VGGRYQNSEPALDRTSDFEVIGEGYRGGKRVSAAGWKLTASEKQTATKRRKRIPRGRAGSWLLNTD